MLHLLLPLLLLVPQAPPAQDQGPPAPKPTYDQGPMQVTLLAMRETRVRVVADEEPPPGFKSDLRIWFRLQGEHLSGISRFGDLILTELVDDTGKSLLADDMYTEEDKTRTRPMTMPAERLRQSGLVLPVAIEPPARQATALKTLRGSVRVILAQESESYTIVHPLQYYGRTIEDARLQAMGVQVRLVPFDEIEQPLPEGRCVVLQYQTKAENIASAKFFDSQMQPVRGRESALTTKSGETCTVFYLTPEAYNDQLQLVLDIHSKVEDKQLTIELDNIELP